MKKSNLTWFLMPILCVLFLLHLECKAAPQSICIQGTLTKADGSPTTGTRMCRIQFYDAASGGMVIGDAISGSVDVSSSGRFSIEITPPEGVFGIETPYYEIAIDSASPPDGSIDSEDVFPQRVRINSVLYSHALIRQGSGSGLDADNLDGKDSAAFAGSSHLHALSTLNGQVTDAQVPDDITVDHATMADGLTGGMESRIQLAEGVYIDTAPTGKVLFHVDDITYELSRYNPWKHPHDLNDKVNPSDGRNNRGMYPGLAMSSNGSAVLAWVDDGPVGDQIFISTFDPTEGWHHPEGVNDFISTGTQSITYGSPHVAMDDEGDAIIVWYQDINEAHDSHVFMSERRDGIWDHPDSVDDHISPIGGGAYYPDVAMDDDNNAVIVWTQSSGGKNRIFKSEYRKGTKYWYWNHPDHLNDYISPNIGGGAGSARVYMNNTGRAMIIWPQLDTSNDRQLFKSEYYLGYWHHPSDFDDAFSVAGSTVASFDADMNDDGEVVIAWNQGDDFDARDIYVSERREGVWQHPSDAYDFINPDIGGTSLPNVAMNEYGLTYIVWEQEYGDASKLMMSMYTGVSWYHPDDFDDAFFSMPGTHVSIPIISFYDNRSRVICVWGQRIDRVDYLFKAEKPGGIWQLPESKSDAINPWPQSITESVDEWILATDYNGNIIIAWEQIVSANTQVYISEYRPLN